MAWLARLDARAATAVTPIRWSYLALRWFLIVMGAWCIIGLAFNEIREQRVGLGTGTVVAVLFGLIKGISMAVTSRDSPPAP